MPFFTYQIGKFPSLTTFSGVRCAAALTFHPGWTINLCKVNQGHLGKIY